MLFIKILYSYIFPVFSVLNTKDEPRMNQGRTKDEPKNSKIEKSTFIKIAVSYTLPASTERWPRDDREKSEKTFARFFAQFHWLFLNIAFLKRLTKILKKFTPFLKQLPSCISFAFLRTLSMPLCPLAPNLIGVLCLNILLLLRL